MKSAAPSVREEQLAVDAAVLLGRLDADGVEALLDGAVALVRGEDALPRRDERFGGACQLVRHGASLPRRNGGDARQLLALQELERGAAARGNPATRVGEPELRDARTESPPPTTEYASHRPRPRRPRACPPRTAAIRRRPSGRSRRSVRGRDQLGETLAAGRADVEAEPALGKRVERRHLRLRVLFEGRRGDHIARQLDLEVERSSRRAAPRPSCRR